MAIEMTGEAVAIESTSMSEDFQEFYSRERRAVVGLAYVLSGSRSGAEDLAQEAFIAAFRRWDEISGYDDPGAWVRRVAANRATSWIRRRAAETRALLRIKGSDFTMPVLDAEADLIWREVRRLPTRQAQTIALRYLDGQEVSEIAETLQCSVNTVHTHLRRAKERLARRFEDKEIS